VRLALVACLLLASPAFAEPYQPKKDRERAAKTQNNSPPPVVGVKPAKLIYLFNLHTNDWLAIDPNDPPTAHALSLFLRDHFTNEWTKMEPKLLSALVAAAQQFQRDLVEVTSAFRHPKYNLMLRKKGRQVARDSQHTHGNAVDFTIPGVSITKLHEWAKAQKLGGVGIYLSSNFVHMDVGPIRFWEGD
jgi:uncharacterized protein YcbK (DUF882 family)